MDLEAADGLTVGSLQGRRTGGGFEASAARAAARRGAGLYRSECLRRCWPSALVSTGKRAARPAAHAMTPQDVSDQRGTRTFEHTFDSPDGTDADTSASDEQLAAAAAAQQQRSADAAAADQVNTAAGAPAGRLASCRPCRGLGWGAVHRAPGLACRACACARLRPQAPILSPTTHTRASVQARSTTSSAPWAQASTPSGSRAWCASQLGATTGRRGGRRMHQSQRDAPTLSSYAACLPAASSHPLLLPTPLSQSYFWYKQVKAQCEEQLGAACAMGGYTRLLHRCGACGRAAPAGAGQRRLPPSAAHLTPAHLGPNVPLCSGKPDAWVDEIPTVVVDPLPRHLDEIAAVRGQGRGCPARRGSAAGWRLRRPPTTCTPWQAPRPGCARCRRRCSCLPPDNPSTAPPALPPHHPATPHPPLPQGYVVLERPYAFKQWVEKYLDTIPGAEAQRGLPTRAGLPPAASPPVPPTSQCMLPAP